MTNIGQGALYFPQTRGLVAVWGKESLQFLNGMITNDVAALDDGREMIAAFPNAQGRLLAIVRVLRRGERFLIETEAATREKVFQNLFRFTFAGDFFVEDLSGDFDFFATFNRQMPAGGIGFRSGRVAGLFLPKGETPPGGGEIGPDQYEAYRIECGVPLFGVDCDETTIVPELGIDGMISYNKGCYIGQEIIARIHFRGHVAKQLRRLDLSGPVAPGTELTAGDGKPAGRVTSAVFSEALGKFVALAYVRYDYLADGTELRCGQAEGVVSCSRISGVGCA
jgi:folate-binding protein YgfZ